MLLIARAVDNPATPSNESQTTAFSAVSGLYHTGNPRQSVTGDNPGSQFGSRQAQNVGYYAIPVLAGNYTVETEYISSNFTGGSKVGPLSQPISISAPTEFWNKSESNADDVTDSDVLSVAAGQTVSSVNIILNTQYGTFDRYEDDGALRPPLVPWLRREDQEAA